MYRTSLKFNVNIILQEDLYVHSLLSMNVWCACQARKGKREEWCSDTVNEETGRGSLVWPAINISVISKAFEFLWICIDYYQWISYVCFSLRIHLVLELLLHLDLKMRRSRWVYIHRTRSRVHLHVLNHPLLQGVPSPLPLPNGQSHLCLLDQNLPLLLEDQSLRLLLQDRRRVRLLLGHLLQLRVLFHPRLTLDRTALKVKMEGNQWHFPRLQRSTMTLLTSTPTR